MRSNYYYTPRVKVYDGEKASDIFNVHDNNFLDGTRRDRPPDFEMHLAIYILEREHMPDDILDRVKQWAKENPMFLGVKE